jgi:uncharacterized 2Fe-2S/4Fe-4S cluster protein (DUF4445 family)
MSVLIKFEPDGTSGMFPEGTSILDAARNLGFQIPDCGVCDGACAVSIVAGSTLLSDLTDIERKELSPQRLAAGERLACQCKVERAGEVVIRLAEQSERTRPAEEKTRDLRREFSELPFDRKIATLMQLETDAATEAFEKITDASISFGKKIFDSFLASDAAKTDKGAPEKEKTV